MAANLASHGWQFIVVDIQWYEPAAQGWEYRPDAKLNMDANGRLIPAENRFPSAANGKGFKPLADYVHAKGLKFGIHILRGIPRQAVAANTARSSARKRLMPPTSPTNQAPANGTPICTASTPPSPAARNITIPSSPNSPQWGVDFVKVDDLSRTYHKSYIEAIRKAIDNSGRPMIFSTSPGATTLAEADHIASHANMWRISDDFWDKWDLLKEQFQRCADWAPHTGPGHFPDADMLPVGAITVAKQPQPGPSTRFTKDEQFTMMTLWSISRSPLIYGGDLEQMDPLHTLAADE